MVERLEKRSVAWWVLIPAATIRWVRIWCKQHNSRDPSCLVSTVQAVGGGIMVWSKFSWHTLGLLVPTHLLIPSFDKCFQQDSVPCRKARSISNWFLEHDKNFTVLHNWLLQSPDLNKTEHLRNVVKQEIYVNKSVASAWCYHVYIDQNTLEYPIQSSTSDMKLIKLCGESILEARLSAGIKPHSGLSSVVLNYCFNW